jgi:hypothetical protein
MQYLGRHEPELIDAYAKLLPKRLRHHPLLRDRPRTPIIGAAA